MIQIYSPNNTNFNMNGDEVLTPSFCDAEAELGGTWTLEMTHPIDDEGKWKWLVKEAVVSVPTFMGKNQLYRIDEIDKQDKEVEIKAYPVFFDSADEVFLMDTRPTEKNGQQALGILTKGTRYSGESNITSVSTTYFIRRNLMDAINGDSPSFIEKWGGEPLYDNFKVIINERAGGDYGAEVRYGKNMDGISFREDMSEVVTRIVPVAFNGRTLSSNYVDSPLINKYAKIYTKEIVFKDVKYYEDIEDLEDTSNLIVCNSQEELDAALIKKCNEQFEAGIDLYKVTIDIDVISLENTEEYKDFKDIVRIGLGDTVGCYNKRLDITTQARAIKIKWDCITDSIKEVTIGDYEYDVFDSWNSSADKIENIVNKDGTVMAEKVQGILDGINTQLRLQLTAAKKQDVRAILFENLDPNSPLYGAMALGTQGFQISNERTTDGRDWEWTTAFTAKGGYADVIIAGLLTDATGRNCWNLNTGEVSFEGYNASIKKNEDEIASRVKSGDVVSEINQSAEQITLKGNRVVVESTNWTVNADGSQICKNINITGGGIDLSATSNTEAKVIVRNSSTGQLLQLSPAFLKFITSDNAELAWINGALGVMALSTGGYETRIAGTGITCGGSLSVSGTKSRKAFTENYGERLLYCYETPSPMFGDIGEGKIDETGKCFVFLDDIFAETIDNDCTYQVFLQPYGKGECYVTERNSSYFIIEGTENLSFGWELKAVQRDYDTIRLEEYEELHTEKNTIDETEAYLYSLINEEDTVYENEIYLESLVQQEESEEEI